MTRKHNAPRRANHHERAAAAARVARVMRRATTPARLYFIGMQMARWEQLIWLLGVVQEVAGKQMATAHGHHRRLTNKATQIQGELA